MVTTTSQENIFRRHLFDVLLIKKLSAIFYAIEFHRLCSFLTSCLRLRFLPQFPTQRRDPGKASAGAGDGDDSDPMSEDESEDGEDIDGDGNASNGIAGVSVAGAGAAPEPAGGGGSSTNAHKFMPTIEVELQMQQLWQKEARTLDLLFSSGRRRTRVETGRGPEDGRSLGLAQGGVSGEGRTGDASGGGGGGIEEGFRMFFVRALAVPPPRFRPPMNMGDFIAEHPQNVYLTKVRQGKTRPPPALARRDRFCI